MAVDMGVNQASVESIIGALIMALSEDPMVLEVLRDKISAEIPRSGLGYIGTGLLREVEVKINKE